ncbi:tRNA uridine(34) 5-carboxymethylaminomethyl modification radical SAM/GNAT enzyme Elp3, partial [Candidatus Parcubacteria bacterium]|nr:tRNA uridine(34) 5-carboxymethylaminomethyl modification radical SAM/GNAT enzyme Elp3 [Candidatus Parcubacteria bacterium]
MLEEKILKALIKFKPKTKKELEWAKKELTKKYKIPPPNNFLLLKVYHQLLKKKRIKREFWLEKLLKKRPIRSLSGIVNITVATKPYSCPGSCIFCPMERGLPKSYLSGEPAIERAKEVNFDPFLQVKSRIETLKIEGHATDKIELRIIGGTWSFYPVSYQKWFIKRCFEGANGKSSKTLKIAQRMNENAKNKIVGISIETRADSIDEKEIKKLREFGVTLVEIGVQSVFDEILEKNKTGLNRKKIIQATKLLKDAGFKVLYHLMPNLFGSNLKVDYQCFKEVFENPDFRPDWIKIYPTLVLENTLLFNLWKEKKYRPYSEKELINLLIRVKKMTPPWIRITRILRDIPSTKIVAGCKISNLRQLVKKEMEKRGKRCNCIRCREVRENYDPKEKVYLFRQEYEASGGKEIFLSFENKEKTKLYSFLRL